MVRITCATTLLVCLLLLAACASNPTRQPEPTATLPTTAEATRRPTRTPRPEPTATAEPTGLIQQVTTDKAMYAPGEPVTILVELLNHTGAAYDGDVTLSFYHLGDVVASEQTQPVPALDVGASATLTFTWTPPPMDFMGYRVEAQALVPPQTTPLESAATAMEVSSDWRKFPRYGYVSRFGVLEKPAAVMARLNEYHINGLQFYDWHWQHHRPYSPEETWPDLANRQISRAIVTQMIEEAQEYNMVTMAYNLAYGAFDNYWEDGSGVQVAWGLFKEAGGNYTVEQQDHHMLPSSWAASKIYLFNPGDAGWQQYIFGRQQEVFDHFAFDGWHIDTLGNRGPLWDWSGNPVNQPDTFADFINNARASLQKPILFNAVGGYGLNEIAAQADVDFIYVELWENDGFRTYQDIWNLVARVRTQTDKAIVLAAYMNRGRTLGMPPGASDFFNDPSVLLANAAIFASGAAHLELGDENGMLSHEYFPNASLRMSSSLRVALKDYYDFLVAYENLLRDDVSDGRYPVTLDGVETSTDGRAGTVWTLVKTKPGYRIVHLINLANNERDLWRDTDGLYPYPDTLTNLEMKIYDTGNLSTDARVWYASPDDAHGKAYELPYTAGSDGQGAFIAFTLPRMQYWDMVWLEE